MARIQKKIKARDTFYILTNGKETEKNYFELIKSKKSIYDVKIEYHNDDPLNLVRIASRLVKQANQVWCVFDIDNTFEENSLIPAIKLAEENNINIAFSNIAFEVWLLSHYKQAEKRMDNNQLIKEIDDLCKKELKISNGYDKSNKELLKTYFIPKIKDAITNAKINYQKRVLQHEKQYSGNQGFRIWEWNSCTNVYMLIEALKLEKL